MDRQTDRQFFSFMQLVDTACMYQKNGHSYGITVYFEIGDTNLFHIWFIDSMGRARFEARWEDVAVPSIQVQHPMPVAQQLSCSFF